MVNELFQLALWLWQPSGLPVGLLMAEPTTIAIALAATTAAVGAYSAIRQGQAAKGAANYNAAIAEQNAKRAKQQSDLLAEQSQRETYLRLGTIKANAAKNGGTSDQGSVLDIIGDSAAQGELQRQSIIRAGSYKAGDYNNTATLDSYQAHFAGQSGDIGAASSLLGGASTAYTNALLLRK